MPKPPVPARFLSSALTPAIDAERAPIRATARHEIRLGVFVVLAYFGLFLGWAAFAHLDAAAVAQGQIIVQARRQAVQNKDGGIVSALHVKEGQAVKAGDILVELNASDAEALEHSYAGQAIALLAQRARLQAEALGGGRITWPAEFAAYTGYDADVARNAMRVQQAQLSTRSAATSAQKAILGRRAAELNEQISGYGEQVASTEKQTKLLGDQLAGLKGLAEKGYASINTIRALERSQAELGGSKGQYAASMASARQQISETQSQAVSVDRQRAEEVSSLLRDTELQLAEALPKWKAAQDQLARVQVRAPAAGMVTGLSVFTVGGVVAPGQKLMDIIPQNAPMIIQAQVSPNDAADLHSGERTEVKLTAFHQRDMPIIHGTITGVSADSFADEKSGRSYFTMEVTVPSAELAGIKRRDGAPLELKPGLPVSVVVPLRRRTALQYLLEPLTDAAWRSFREH